jgi:hypothetical protein
VYGLPPAASDAPKDSVPAGTAITLDEISPGRNGSKQLLELRDVEAEQRFPVDQGDGRGVEPERDQLVDVLPVLRDVADLERDVLA